MGYATIPEQVTYQHLISPSTHHIWSWLLHPQYAAEVGVTARRTSWTIQHTVLCNSFVLLGPNPQPPLRPPQPLRPRPNLKPTLHALILPRPFRQHRNLDPRIPIFHFRYHRLDHRQVFVLLCDLRPWRARLGLLSRESERSCAPERRRAETRLFSREGSNSRIYWSLGRSCCTHPPCGRECLAVHAVEVGSATLVRTVRFPLQGCEG